MASAMGARNKQFRPFTVHFRPAGVRTRTRLGPTACASSKLNFGQAGAKRLDDCSAALDVGRDDCEGGELLWLGMKLFFREVHGVAATPDGLFC